MTPRGASCATRSLIRQGGLSCGGHLQPSRLLDAVCEPASLRARYEPCGDPNLTVDKFPQQIDGPAPPRLIGTACRPTQARKPTFGRPHNRVGAKTTGLQTCLTLRSPLCHPIALPDGGEQATNLHDLATRAPRHLPWTAGMDMICPLWRHATSAPLVMQPNLTPTTLPCLSP